MQLESSVTLFDDNKVENRFAELQITADGITSEVSKKVGNDEVISRINQSAEGIQIQANKVNIEGATIFSSGRLSQNSLNSAYDASGSATGAVNTLKSDLSSASGTTVINGGHIETGTLSAGAVNATSGVFDTANIPDLNAEKITAGTLNAALIGAGTLEIGKLDTSARNKIDNAAKTASNFISTIGSDGISVHAVSNPNSNYVQIDGDGMEIYKGSVSVAKYGDSAARVGKDASQHISIDSNGFHIWKATQNTASNEVASFTDSSISLGKNNLTSVIDMCKSTLKITSKYVSYDATNDCTTTSIAAGDNTKDYNVLELGLAAPNGGAIASARLAFTSYDDNSSNTTMLTGQDSVSISLLGGYMTEISLEPSDTWGYGNVNIRDLRRLQLYSNVGNYTASLWYMGGAPTTGSQTYNAVWTKVTESGNDNYRLGRPSSSSRRYKEDIKPVENNELDPHRLYDIPVMQFKYKEGYFPQEDEYESNRIDVVGFIAEDVLEHYPQAAIVINDEVDNWNERYIIPPMLKLIQELNDRTTELERRLS